MGGLNGREGRTVYLCQIGEFLTKSDAKEGNIFASASPSSDVPVSLNLRPPMISQRVPSATPTIAQQARPCVQPRAEIALKLTSWLMYPRKKRALSMALSPTLSPQSSLRGVFNRFALQSQLVSFHARRERKAWSPLPHMLNRTCRNLTVRPTQVRNRQSIN